ncbi:MAG: hypothetical protein IKH97_09215 [Bacteroidales bacterium]|nr:hypothetical protein [Bacteroidales bacterium]
MIKGELFTASIMSVRFHKEERKVMGALFGAYASNYVARLDLPGDVIVVIDSIAAKMHPDWEKKTDSRAAKLTVELQGKTIKCRVIEVTLPKYVECELLEIL